MKTAGALRILVAHQHRLFGECLTVALSDARGLDDVHLVTDPRDLRGALDTRAPDVVVIRPEDPRAATADKCSAIKRARPATRVVVIDDFPDPDLLLDCVEAGAEGYASLQDDLDVLVETVRRVEGGETIIPPLMLGGLLERLIRRRREAQRAHERFDVLTARERQVLHLLARGMSNDGIADELVVSTHTARTHVQNVLRKLEVHSRVEAVALAVTTGWIDADELAEEEIR